MNHHTDPTEQAREMNDTPDRALESRLRAYYSAEADPAPADLWQWLAPRLDAAPVSTAERAACASQPLTTVTLADDDAVDVGDTDDAPRPPIALRPRGAPRRHSRLMRGVMSAASLVAVLALILGAATLLHRPAGQGGAPSVIQSGALTWRLASLPAGVRLVSAYATTTGVATPSGGAPGSFTYHQLTPTARANADLIVAPSNGNVAYIREIPTKGAPIIWRTTDAGRHWIQLPSLPDRGYKSGDLIVDRNDPLTLIAAFTTTAAPSAQARYDTYVLIKKSRQWQPIYDGPVSIDGLGNLSDWHGEYFATRLTTSPNGFFRSELLASMDQMRSWHAVDAQIIAKDTLAPTGEVGVSNFWVNPTTGALLATTYNETRTGEVWMSEDQGKTWSEVALPPSPVSEVGETNNWVTGAIISVQSLAIGPYFHLCAWYTERSVNDPNTFYCSNDSGATWTHRPLPPLSQDRSSTLTPDGAGIGETTTALSLNPMADEHLTRPRFIGDLPSTKNGNTITALWGVTANSVVFWAMTTANQLYVAQYTLPDM